MPVGVNAFKDRILYFSEPLPHFAHVMWAKSHGLLLRVFDT